MFFFSSMSIFIYCWFFFCSCCSFIWKLCIFSS